MVIVLVIVVLVVVGGAVAFAASSKKRGSADTPVTAIATSASTQQRTPADNSSADLTPAARDQVSTRTEMKTPDVKAPDANTPVASTPEAVAPEAKSSQAKVAETGVSGAVPHGRPTGAPAVVGRDDDDEDDEDDEDDGPTIDRFAARGQRVVSTTDYNPTTPRKPSYLLEPTVDVEPVSLAEPEPVVDSAPVVEFESAPESVPEPRVDISPLTEAVAEADELVGPAVGLAPEPAVEPLVGSAEEVPADLDTEPEVDGTGDDTVIDLDAIERSDPAVVGAEGADEPLVAEVQDASPAPAQNEHADNVLAALIGRIREADQDAADEAEELIERADLDADEMAEELIDLVERVIPDEDVADVVRDQELTLFSEEVPSRPGRLSGFADLNSREKRRVIIRVLCLLVARSEAENRNLEGETERAVGEGGDVEAEVEESEWPLARAAWPTKGGASDDEADLPARRHRLARSRR